MQVRLVAFTIALKVVMFAAAQGSNSIASKYPNQATQNINATYFIIPIDSSIVQTQIGSTYPLLDTTLPSSTFPNGFASGKHPVFVLPGGYNNDIRMGNLQIDHLLAGSIIVPFVDRLKDGKTPFLQYIAAFDSQLVPALVSTLLEGITITQAMFVPSDAAYQMIAPGIFSNEIKTGVANSVSGPGPVNEAIDAVFWPTKTYTYPASTYKDILAQPVVLTDGMCLNVTYFYGDSYADPFFVSGNLTLYSPYLPTTSSFANVPGFAIDSDQVFFNQQACSDF